MKPIKTNGGDARATKTSVVSKEGSLETTLKSRSLSPQEPARVKDVQQDEEAEEASMKKRPLSPQKPLKEEKRTRVISPAKFAFVKAPPATRAKQRNPLRSDVPENPFKLRAPAKKTTEVKV